MRIIDRWTKDIKDIELVAAIGVFDGVHKGHQQLIKDAKRYCKPRQKLAVITFNPHPLAVLAKTGAPPLITITEERRKCFELEGVDIVIELPFTKELASMKPKRFIEIIRQHFNIQVIVVGYNFRFGSNGSGDVNFLERLGSEYGFQVYVVPPVNTSDGHGVSSTAIRRLLSKGKMKLAALMLGRTYSIKGRVVSGYQRGRRIGFPTANIVPPTEKILPAKGVYAAFANVNNTRFFAVVNIGVNPTFDNDSLTIEVHLLNYKGGPLYDQMIEIEFLDYLRRERKFASVVELISQIEKDISIAGSICSLHTKSSFLVNKVINQ